MYFLFKGSFSPISFFFRKLNKKLKGNVINNNETAEIHIVFFLILFPHNNSHS
jgi:hypothetical protein